MRAGTKRDVNESRLRLRRRVVGSVWVGRGRRLARCNGLKVVREQERVRLGELWMRKRGKGENDTLDDSRAFDRSRWMKCEDREKRRADG